jgi:hypothetical protein
MIRPERTRPWRRRRPKRNDLPEPDAPICLNRRHDRIPAGAVYIGRRARGLAASKWGNPFSVRRNATREEREEAIAKYREYLLANQELMAALPELRGKDLACWCAPEPCHGDVLLELANSEPGESQDEEAAAENRSRRGLVRALRRPGR